ncbi:helix-turn-helix transcriptional regulator [Xanthobacter sp. VTT E-85241]|uniref:helix-turn-helix transcriptional regulator n=1 Tax=Roseixanthobacter finlandensis TaxID=3119922 RepID=UPI003729A4D8
MKAKRLVAWNLRRLRVEKGLTQEALAFSAQVDMSYLASLEVERANGSVDLLEQIAQALDVHISELFQPFPEGAIKPGPLRKGRKPLRLQRRTNT